MKCVLTIKIGDKSIEVPHDEVLLSGLDSNLLTLLKNSSKWEDVLSTIEQQLKEKSGYYKAVSLSELQTEKGLIPNSNVLFLQEKYPNIEFPENILANVLFLDNLEIGKLQLFGRNIKADGTELFIVRNSEYDVAHFANFLKLRKQLQQGFSFSEDSDLYKMLLIIKGEKSIIELIEDYSINKDNYTKKEFTYDGKKYFASDKLEQILRFIVDLPLRTIYEDPFIDSINSRITYSLKKGRTYTKLNISTLHTLLKSYYPNFITQSIDKVSNFKKIFSKKSEELLEFFTEEELEGRENGFQIIFNKFLKNYPYEVKSVGGVDLELSYKKATLKNKYDISYSSIKTLEIVNNDYMGYKIYAQNIDNLTYYFPSKHYLTENTITTRFLSLDEAKEYIEQKIQTQDLYENSYIEFNNNENKELQSYKYIPEGTIITIIDLKTDLEKSVPYSYLFKANNTKNDFDKLVDSLELHDKLKQRIKEQIQTPEEIILFIYRLESNSTPDDINYIVNEIKNAPKKHFYIESVKQYKNLDNSGYSKKYLYTAIETEADIIELYKEQQNIPSITLMTAVAESLKEKFGVLVNILSYDDLKNQFPEINEGTKAFIRNGEIFINTVAAKSSDLFHEYTHLLLGVLKANKDTRAAYEQLLYMLMDTNEGRYEYRNIKDNYPELAEIDIYEEVFANLFGKYLSGRISDINNIFKQQKLFLKEINIFDLNSDIELSSIYNKSLNSIFSRFSSDVASKLNQDAGLNFLETINIRKKSAWVNKLIKDGNIIEDCNG